MEWMMPPLPNTTSFLRTPLPTNTTEWKTTFDYQYYNFSEWDSGATNQCVLLCPGGVGVPYLPDDNTMDTDTVIPDTLIFNNTNITYDKIIQNSDSGNSLIFNDIEFIAPTISAGIILVFQLMFIITSVRMSFKSQSDNSYRNVRNHTQFTMQYTQLITVFIYIVYILSAIVTIIRSTGYHLSDTSNIAYISEIVLAVFNSFNAILLYLFMILRISQTFNGTIYSITKCITTIHIINMFIVAALYLFMPFLIFESFLLFIPSDVWIKKIYFAVSFSLFGFGLIHLIYLFNYKLYSLILQQRQTSIKNLDSIQKLNRQQLELMKIVQKHTILGIFVVMPTIAFMIAALIMFGVKSSTELVLERWIIQTICICMETLCLFLGFSVNNTLYQYCCHYCDACCHRICVEITKFKIKSLHPNVPKIYTDPEPEPQPEAITDTAVDVVNESTIDAKRRSEITHESQKTMSVNITDMEMDTFLNLIDEMEDVNGFGDDNNIKI